MHDNLIGAIYSYRNKRIVDEYNIEVRLGSAKVHINATKFVTYHES